MDLKENAFARPNIEEILLHIAPQSFSRWFDIGVLLDVPVQKLRDIKFSDNTQLDVCCMRMFTEWLDGDGNPTWAILSKTVSSCTNSVQLNDYCDKVDRPEPSELVELITPHYAAQWRRIGILLHITGGTLDAIEQEYPTNPNWCCDKMLQTWIETDESASWRILVTVINSLKNKRIMLNRKAHEKPLLKEFIMHIKPQVQCLNTWYSLGVLLGVPVQKLEDIRLSEQDDVDLCCVKMFTEWLDNGTVTTWSTLLRAVDSLHNKQVHPGIGRPQLAEVVNFVALLYTARWKEIGLKLNLPVGSLDAIELGYPTNPEWCCDKMLQKWLEYDTQASWEKLISAISSLDDNDDDNADETIADIIKPVVGKLQAEYQATRYMSTENDWPPDQPKHFTTVALIHHQGASSKHEVIDTLTRQGLKSFINSGVNSQNNYPTQISKATKDISEIFTTAKGNTTEMILIEGAPGIGKTVLCKEIAYQWANRKLLQTKRLLFLLLLRNPDVQKFRSLLELIEHCCRNESVSAKALVHHLYETQGTDLVILFDGYDEVSENVRHRSLIADIIARRVLPKCTLVITSRPSAALQLHNNVSCRVEILGFTNSDRQKFIQDSLKDNPERGDILQNYLDDNAAINTLCYIPLVMTILLCLFKASIDLPKTQTELYQKFICHTIMHFLKKARINPLRSVKSVSDLEQPYLSIIMELSKVSFKLLEDDKIVFTVDDAKQISPKLNISSESCTQLGLLKETKYFSADETNLVLSFNFLHLSVQEFFAAMYVSTLNFFQQKEILQRTFWNSRYFNMWIMYMGLTSGNKNAFKYFLSKSFFSSIVSRRTVISRQILMDKVKCLHLFQCFMEAKRDDICAEIGKDFKDIIIDLNNQTLLPRDVNIVSFYLLRSNKTEWNKLVLSRCNIGDTGCSILHKSLIVGDKNYLLFQSLDLSSNTLTVQSIPTIVDLVKSFKVVELNVANNPFHNALLGFLGEFKHLKSLTTGNISHSDMRTVAVIMKIVNNSSLHYASIADHKNSCLIFRKGDFRILSFPSPDFLTYQYFIMRDCKTTAKTYQDLSELLEAQDNLIHICICNNKFKESMILSICAALTRISFVQLHTVVISESNLSSSTINKIATELYSIPNCSIIVYSIEELKCINVGLAQIIEALEDNPTLSKLDINNCKDESHSLLHGEPLKNAIEVLKLYESSANSLAYLIKVLSFAIVKVICLNRTNIKDETADEMASALSQNHLLTEFDISDSKLTNEAAIAIMKALQNVTTLKSFKIHNCGITNIIADSMSIIFENNCATLTEIDISNNKLCSASPIRALKNTCNLLSFKINCNKFADEVSQDVADTLDNNPYIVEVDVTFNHFSPISGKRFISTLKDVQSIEVFKIGNGIVCEETAAEVALFIQKNTGLKELDLSENHLTAAGTCAIVEALENTNSLQVFKASKHMITKDTVGKMTTFLSNNLTLTVVDISLSLLTTGAVKLIRSFKHKPLQVLRMSNCRITQSEADEIADVIKSTALQELDLSDNQLAVIGVIIISNALKGLGSLQVLNMQNCGITGKAIDKFAGALSTLTNLSELNISSNSFVHSDVLKIIKALENSALQTFKMNQSCIIWPDEINDIVNATQSCKSLLHLELSKGNFSITECLQNVTTLKILNVSQCSGINDDKAKELSTVISKNSSLVSLDISHNRLTTFGATQIAKALQSVTTLQTFVLNNCEITDEAAKHIATAISYNPQLTELNISWNKLSGVGTSKIIQCLENCNQLQTIKFAACGVTSKETEAIATMLSDKTNLRELDISWNGLKADGITAIMKAICNISYLQVLKFNNCDITDKAAETIASTLVAYYTLMELTICHNDFSPSGVATVINSLQSTSTIKVLTTSNCLFDNSSDDIATAIGNNCGLVHLEIYHSHFTTHGARLFSRSFTNIHILQHLKLINCNITEEVAGEIATVLAQNKTIEHLDLSHNPLAAGVTEIVRVLLYNQILQVLILQSCSITDESAFDLVTFAKSTSLVEFDILQNQLTDNGSFIVAKGFMDSLTIKVLKIRDWYKIFHEGNYEDDNYVLDSLRGKHVSLHLE